VKRGLKRVISASLACLIIASALLGLAGCGKNNAAWNTAEAAVTDAAATGTATDAGTLETFIPEAEIPMNNGAGLVTEKRTVSTFDAVKAMGVGWNLGNTLDSLDPRQREWAGKQPDKTREEYYETYWGNPLTTKAMIDAVAKAGFGAVRIPVTYSDHMDEYFTINAAWLDRVGQIVKYALDNDIYCIINLHHDTGHGSWPWLKADPENSAKLESRLRYVWMQIAVYFKDYGDKLIFESFNEILDTKDRWGNSDIAAYDVVNRLNQVFVDAVRGVGGNNGDRILVVKPYAASAAPDILDAFKLPVDKVKDRLIVGVHYYGNAAFVWSQSQVSWTTVYTDWNSERDGKPVEEFFESLNRNLIAKGIPVLVCEFGAVNKSNTADRVKYAKHYVETGKKYGITCFWWDDGGQYDKAEQVVNHSLLDRKTNKWFFPKIVDAMMAATK